MTEQKVQFSSVRLLSLFDHLQYIEVIVIAGAGNLSLFYSLLDGTARFIVMYAVIKPAFADIGLKFQYTLGELIPLKPGEIQGRKARCISDQSP